MIKLKTLEEIKLMQEGGRKLKEVVNSLRPKIKAGITTRQIDQEADKLIRELGGEASFKKVPRYHFSICIPINEQIVHTPPSGRLIRDGDIVTLDIGMYYKGFHTDFADTIGVGHIDREKKKFIETGKNALYKAINKAKVGRRLGEVSQTIQREIYGQGFFVIKKLTGHGIGRELHEEPFVLGYLEGKIENTLLLKPGLIIAIEVIYSKGSEDMVYEEGKEWSIKTADDSLSACFEHTVAITNNGPLILT